MQQAHCLPIIACFLSAFCSSLHAWSHKEHIQVTRIAATRLLADPDTPESMKRWLRDVAGHLPGMEGERDYFMTARVGLFPRGVDGLPFWATVPDLVAMADKREEKIAPFGVPEARLHFIDLEFFMPQPDQQIYRDDLSHRPAISDIPRNIKDPRFARAGMLPFAVEQMYRRMVESIRNGRLNDRPGQFPRDDHAVKWAGYLAHYLADNTQPHHATEDYKSRSYFKDPLRAPNIHSDMEYRLVDDDDDDYPELRERFCELFAAALDNMDDPVRTDDVWMASLEVSHRSYEALPLIGRAAQAAYPQAGAAGPGKWHADVFFNHRGNYMGRQVSVLELKAHQLAWAVRRIEQTWCQAWREAGR